MNSKCNSGFTLLETLAVVIVVGILAAIAVPSFLGMYKRQQFNSSVDKIVSTMQVTQREAMRKSSSCILTIPEGTNVGLTSTCQLLDNAALNNAVVDHIRWNSDTGTVIDVTGSLEGSYNFKGNPTETISGVNFTDLLTIVSDTDNSRSKCIVTSLIGATRVGDWDGVSCVAS